MAANEGLIGRYVELNPHYPDPSEARLIGYGTSVWAIIGHLRAIDGGVAQTAEDYAIPREAVEAAIAYYDLHRSAIDARLAKNETLFAA